MMHWHTCPPCQQKWSHNWPGPEGGHLCPKCKLKYTDRYDTEELADASMRPPMFHNTDPNCIIPVGQLSAYKVMGFSSEKGTGIHDLTVKVRYDEHNWSTDLAYLAVLYTYFSTMDNRTFVERHLCSTTAKG